jgi:sec-independent protein translocase protein TatA
MPRALGLAAIFANAIGPESGGSPNATDTHTLWVVVLVIALIVLGPKRLPEVGRSIGNGMREFKDAISGNSKDDDEDEVTQLKTSERT